MTFWTPDHMNFKFGHRGAPGGLVLPAEPPTADRYHLRTRLAKENADRRAAGLLENEGAEWLGETGTDDRAVSLALGMYLAGRPVLKIMDATLRSRKSILTLLEHKVSVCHPPLERYRGRGLPDRAGRPFGQREWLLLAWSYSPKQHVASKPGLLAWQATFLGRTTADVADGVASQIRLHATRGMGLTPPGKYDRTQMAQALKTAARGVGGWWVEGLPR